MSQLKHSRSQLGVIKEKSELISKYGEYIVNLVINAQKIPATNSGPKNSEFSIFINLLTNQELFMMTKTIKLELHITQDL